MDPPHQSRGRALHWIPRCSLPVSAEEPIPPVKRSSSGSLLFAAAPALSDLRQNNRSFTIPLRGWAATLHLLILLYIYNKTLNVFIHIENEPGNIRDTFIIISLGPTYNLRSILYIQVALFDDVEIHLTATNFHIYSKWNPVAYMHHFNVKFKRI